MSEDVQPSTPGRAVRLRLLAGTLAGKFVGGFMQAVCAKTWMPGISSGMTATLLDGRRPRDD